VFNLLGNEFTMDVDVSKLGCGLNGAVYFVSMDADGGMSKYSGNKAGAKYGTGYCDSQCPRDLKFIDGIVRNHHNMSALQPANPFALGQC
jgi:cellulose 1,4-beta-cellobiosidase